MSEDRKTLRTFVCVEPPTDVADELGRFVAGLRAMARNEEYKWVSRAQLHLTLRFLGTASAETVSAMDRALRALRVPGEFRVSLAGGGAFPGLARARVLWMGVSEGEGKLAGLAELVEGAAVAAGYEPEPRKFKAHLTLARARGESALPERLREALTDEKKTPVFSWLCRGFALKRSELTPGGPIYTTLGEYKLTDCQPKANPL